MRSRIFAAMSYTAEFQTIDAILACSTETRGIDAFALSVIKAERQIRKLFTHLVFQAPAFGSTDIQNLRKVLADNRDVYFDGFIAGWDNLYTSPISDLVGQEYQSLLALLREATRHRNKIFHGQLTNSSLTRNNLLVYVETIRDWCCKLAEGALKEIGYDGFGRNSFHKSRAIDIGTCYRVVFKSVVDYESFIHSHMER